MSPHIHPLKTKVKKPSAKGEKAQSVEKVTVAELLPQLEQTTFQLDSQPYSSLFTIFQKEFLAVSAEKGLIHREHLVLAGDGTPVVTSHRERKKRICDCKQNGIFDCKCDRYFSQPDCDIGWDSSRNCFYHGYDLYMLVDSQSDLPVFPLYSCASKHDSHGFLEAFFRMKAFLPDYHVEKILLDSAHDAIPYYQYFKRVGITPFIDLNGKGGRPPVYKNDFTIDTDGVPLCPCGHRMRFIFSCNFFVPRTVFTFQSTSPEFHWHDHSRFRKIMCNAIPSCSVNASYFIINILFFLSICDQKCDYFSYFYVTMH